MAAIAPPRPPADRPTAGARPAGRGASGGGVLNVFSHAFLIVWAVLVVLPLLWAVLQSVRTDREILTDPWGLPTSLQWDNFVRAWSTSNIGDYFLSTLIVVCGGVFFTMLLGSMAAYVLARYPFPGNRFIYYLFVAGLTVPIFLALIPLFFVVRNSVGLNTYHGLILVYVGYSLPFTVFFLHSFFRTLPTAVAESAAVDGAGHTRIFFQVMLPMAKPGLISVGIFNLVGQWNQFVLPQVLMQKQSGFDADRSVLAQGLVALAIQQGYRSDWSALFAGMTIAMLPILVVYVIFQRQVQTGLTGATLK
ncbi:carbohydrate ABC transporter permease [Natronosporangium hydrolyticum]|uniref:Carbohydrate ABC transporter permease n=1 Tax=Natronosporangium hydrolyticum TaxID=2811111 RepID=A0A895YEU4_9ACTN|nr:carbohydrate ABC transporter permease [Natronosporangium hydrolyticum]QSB16101.1 carbohydrate ABC transporter permease [Natronosporangium hydrolyticum]